MLSCTQCREFDVSRATFDAKGRDLHTMKQHRNILAVNDFVTMRRILRHMLRQLGYVHTFEADHGAAALMILLEQHIDLVIIDWNMPRMAAMKLLKAIREHEKLQTTPILVIIAHGSHDDISQAINAGVSSYVIEPFTADTLQTEIDTLFNPVVQPLSWLDDVQLTRLS